MLPHSVAACLQWRGSLRTGRWYEPWQSKSHVDRDLGWVGYELLALHQERPRIGCCCQSLPQDPFEYLKSVVQWTVLNFHVWFESQWLEYMQSWLFSVCVSSVEMQYHVRFSFVIFVLQSVDGKPFCFVISVE